MHVILNSLCSYVLCTRPPLSLPLNPMFSDTCQSTESIVSNTIGPRCSTSHEQRRKIEETWRISGMGVLYTHETPCLYIGMNSVLPNCGTLFWPLQETLLRHNVYCSISLIVINVKFLLQPHQKYTSHSKENLAFHSLLRWKMIIIQILATPLMHFLFKRLGECTFWAQDWKG